MNRLFSPGIYVLLLIFIAGIWLCVSPFAMQTQAAGEAWTAATINNVGAGGLLIAVSLLGVLIHTGLALRQLVGHLC